MDCQVVTKILDSQPQSTFSAIALCIVHITVFYTCINNIYTYVCMYIHIEVGNILEDVRFSCRRRWIRERER